MQFLNYIYGFGYVLIAVLLVAALLLRGRRGGFNKAWAPLRRLVPGTVKSRRRSSTLSGKYQDHPVRATITRGKHDEADCFSVEIPVGTGGRDWELAHRSEKLLGPESWRVFTKDPALEAKMEAAGVAATLKDWPDHTTVRYDSARGTLTLLEPISSPPAARFKAQLDLLEWLAEVNRRLNG